MKVVVLVLAVGVSILCCSDWGVAQPAAIQPVGPQDAGLLGAVPPEVLPKIEQPARLLQKGVNDGTLSEGQITPELNHGNLAGLVEDLNPEVKQLLYDISTSLRANHSKETLGLLLGGVTELARSVQSQAKPLQPSQSDLSLKPTMKSDVPQPVPVRPYNLDQLISDRAKAEADLDSMISEMRGRMKGR
ncbi:MAG: hypothetical protein L0Z46_01710 [Nitrospiraceae bacterium]|nr:hypothetical protein [Nitrospiraceae bacterium]